MDKQAYQSVKKYINDGYADAVLIARTDSFLGEYYPPDAVKLQKISGFTGSAGLALITKDKDVLFVDSRYTIQAKQQSSFVVYEVPTETNPSQWINQHLSGKTVAYNPQTYSVSWKERFERVLTEQNVQLVPVSSDVFCAWFGDDIFVQTDVFDYDIQFAGETTESKLNRLMTHIQKNKWDAYVVSSPENVSWLLNKRAKTVLEYPVVFERGFVDNTGKYTPLNEQTIHLLNGKRIAIDTSSASVALFERLSEISIVEKVPDIIQVWKACKNSVEIQNIKQACLSESKTICRFLAWIEQNKAEIDEIQCDKKLIALRQEDSLYFADSFETIAAVGGHAALAHYRADEFSNKKLTEAPLLLVDTGGHYLNGTTDMTRTIAVGEATSLMKKRYTQVLQGHIDMALSTLTTGESTAQMDKKAHHWLRQDKADYLHATSHGIGLMLAVHEMPPIVSEYDTLGIRAGMVFSNEPAFYSEADAFGIRLENMLLAVQTQDNGIRFENLLFIPFDYRLIEFNRLTDEQKEWLKIYHQTIYDVIFPMLSETEQHILLPFVQAFHIQTN